jgi:hypothetical protein
MALPIIKDVWTAGNQKTVRHTPEIFSLPICWAGQRWARSRGYTEGAAAGRRIVGTFPQQRIRLKKQCIARRFLGNAYRNISALTATNLQSTTTAKNAISLLLKEVIFIRFDQNLAQGENWPTETEYDRRPKTNRRQKKKSEEVRSEVFILCGVVTVTLRVLSLFVVTKCYSYRKIVLQLTVVPPGE